MSWIHELSTQIKGRIRKSRNRSICSWNVFYDIINVIVLNSGEGDFREVFYAALLEQLDNPKAKHEFNPRTGCQIKFQVYLRSK